MPKAALLLTKVMFVVFLLFPGETALQAQGTGGILADRMTSQELVVYLKRYVQPSFDEWIALGDAQDAYQIEFAKLHDDFLAEVLAEHRALQRAGSVPSTEEIRQIMESLDKANERIQRLDSRFFDSIAVLIPEEKIPGLERIRLARKRTQYQNSLLSSMGMGSDMDLWTYIDKEDLDEQERTVVLAKMQPYERKATRLLSKGSDAAASILLAIAEEVEALGFEIDQSNMTPEVSAQFMEAYMRGYGKAMERNASLASELRTLNARTLRDLTSALDPWEARKIKSAYFANASKMMIEELHRARAVPEDAKGYPEFEEFVKNLSSNEELLGDLKDEFDELALSYILEDHARLDRMLELVNKIDPLLEQLGPPPTESEEGERTIGKPTLQEQVVAIQRARAKAQLERTRHLLAMIEEEGSDELKEVAQTPRNLTTYGVSPQTRVLSFRSLLELERMSSWVPSAMGFEILGKIQRVLPDEEWSQAVLETLHEEYLADWNQSIVPVLRDFQEYDTLIYAIDPKTEQPIVDEAGIRKLQRLHNDVMKRASVVDGGFFENVALTVPEESVDSIGLLRAARGDGWGPDRGFVPHLRCLDGDEQDQDRRATFDQVGQTRRGSTGLCHRFNREHFARCRRRNRSSGHARSRFHGRVECGLHLRSGQGAPGRE